MVGVDEDGYGAVRPDTDRIVVYTRAWRSGAGLYAQGLVEGLAAAGRQVTFIAPEGAPDDRAASMPQVKRVRPPREIVGKASRLRKAVASARRIVEGCLALLVARLTASRFIITIPDPFVATLWPIFLLRLTGAQVVFVCHDPEPHSWSLPGWARPVERAGYAAIYTLASRIVVLAASGKGALATAFGAPPEKIVVIPHGVFHVESVGPVNRTMSVLLFGTIRRNKNVLLAIDAVAKARADGLPVKLLIAGAPDSNEPGYLEECRQRAASVGAGVEFEVGFISDDRLMSLAARCDAFLLPYANFESQSGVAILAAAAGRPVVATRAGGIADLMDIGIASAEIERPLDAASISAALATFYETSPADWTVRAAQGRRRLLDSLGWQNIGAQFAASFALSAGRDNG